MLSIILWRERERGKKIFFSTTCWANFLFLFLIIIINIYCIYTIQSLSILADPNLLKKNSSRKFYCFSFLFFVFCFHSFCSFNHLLHHYYYQEIYILNKKKQQKKSRRQKWISRQKSHKKIQENRRLFFLGCFLVRSKWKCMYGGGRERGKHKNSQTNKWCKPKSDDENFIFYRKNIQNKQTLKEITKKRQ